jgi:hypothetical protein
MHAGRSLTDDIRMWRTPDAPNDGGPRNRQTSIGHGHQVTIAEQAEHWPTPTARDYKDGTADACANVPVNCLLGRVAPLWMTPNVPNGGRTLDDETVSTKGTQADGTKRQVDLGSQVRLWATPRAEDSEQCGNHPGANDSLTGQTRLWQTPATDSFRSRSGDRKDEQGLDQQTRMWKVVASLDGASTSASATTRTSVTYAPALWPDLDASVPSGGDGTRTPESLWPTPTAEPYGSSQNGINGIGGTHERPSANTPSLERMSRSFLPLLATASDGETSCDTDPILPLLSPTNTWQTPCAGTNRKSERAMQPSVNNGRRSGGGQSSPPGLEQQAELATTGGRRAKLNPRFVSWLMNLPIGWTEFSPIASINYARWATQSSRQLRHLLFAYWRSAPGSCR